MKLVQLGSVQPENKAAWKKINMKKWNRETVKHEINEYNMQKV